MKKKINLMLLLFLLMIILTGCLDSNYVGINFDKAYLFDEEEAEGLDYNWDVWSGNDNDYRYALKGYGNTNNIGFTVNRIVDNRQEHIKILLWIKNLSNQPVSVSYDQFNLVSIDNKIYSPDFDKQWDTDNFIIELQPKEDNYISLYFKVGDKSFEDIKDWKLSYSFRRGLKKVNRFVFSRITYIKQEINP